MWSSAVLDDEFPERQVSVLCTWLELPSRYLVSE